MSDNPTINVIVTERLENIEGATEVVTWKATVPCATVEQAENFLAYDPCTGKYRDLISVVEG